MLPAEYRMRRARDFERTVRQGRRAGRRLLVVHAVRDGDAGGGVQVGFVVSRAIGGAVVRNSVRRRLRHLMRDRLARLPGGVEIVVRARPSAAGAGHDQLAAELDEALGRALARVVAAR